MKKDFSIPQWFPTLCSHAQGSQISAIAQQVIYSKASIEQLEFDDPPISFNISYLMHHIFDPTSRFPIKIRPCTLIASRTFPTSIPFPTNSYK